MQKKYDGDNALSDDENDDGRLLFSKETEASPDPAPFYQRRENVVGAVLTFLWLVASVDFLNASGWWVQRYDMTPPEFMGFLSGLLTPVALIWFVVFYFAGHKRYDDEAARLRTYMRAFLNPSPQDKIYAKTLMESMKNRTAELRDAYDDLTRAGGRIAEMFDKSAGSFAGLTQTMNDVLRENIAALDEKTDALKKMTADSSEKVRSNVTALDEVIRILNETIAKAAEAGVIMEEQIRQGSEMMRSAETQMIDSGRVLAREMCEQAETAAHAGERVRDLLTQQTAEIKETTAAQTDALQKMADEVRRTVAEQTSLMDEDIRRNMNDVLQAQEQVRDHVAAVSLSVGEQTDALASASQNARANMESMSSALEKRIDVLTALFDRQDELIAAKDAALTETADKMAENFRLQNTQIDGQIENIVSRFKVIETSLESYVREIASVSGESTMHLEEVVDALKDKKDVLKETADIAASAVVSLSDDIERKNQTLSENAERLEQAGKILSDKMAEHSVKIGDMLGMSAEQAEMFEQRLSVASSSFTAAIADCDEKTRDIAETLDKKAAALSDLGNALTSQSMVTQTSLEQQQKYLAGAQERIDGIKTALKEQADDLFAVASLLNDKTRETVEHLMAQMTNAAAQANGTVGALNEADAILSTQTEALNAVTNALREAYDKLIGEIKTHQDEFRRTTAVLVDKTDDLGTAVDRQVALMDAAADRMDKRTRDAVDLMREHFDTMEHDADAVLKRVDEASEKLNSGAAEVTVLFDKQESSLSTASEKLAEQAGGVVELLREQSERMDADLERLVSRIRLIQEGLDVQAKEISSVSEMALSQLEKVGETIEHRTDALSVTTDVVKEKIDDAAQNFAQKTQEFSDTLKTTTAQTLDAAEQLEFHQAQFKSATDALSDGVNGLGDSLTTQAESLKQQAEKSTKQAIMVRDAMQRQIVELSDVANVVTTQSRLGEASLGQQTRYLREAAEEIMSHIRAVNDAVKQNTNDLLGASSRIGFELDAMGENLRQRNDEAAKAAEETLSRSADAAAFLQEKAALLAQVAKQVVAGIQTAGVSFDEQTKRVNAAAAAARDELSATGDSFLVQAYQLNRISEEAQKAIKGLSVVLREKAMDFNKTADHSGERVDALRDVVRRLAAEFEEMSNKGVIQIDLAGQRLRSMLGEVAANSERIAGEVRKSGEQFVGQSDVLSKAATESMEKLTALLDMMKQDAARIQESGDKISAQSVKLGGAFNRQVQALVAASKTAEDYVVELDRRKEEADTKRYMNDASFIIEKLQSVGVDMARLFTPEIQDDLWKRYYGGDKSAFLRHLSRALDKGQVRRMSDMYTENQEFRDYVSKYMGEFDMLLQAAQATERGDVMSAVLLGSEAGHLYLLLNKVFSE